MTGHRHIAFWKLVAAELSAAVVCAGVIFYFRTRSLLADAPSGDLYANNWGFQFVVFAAVWLPATLLIVGVVVAIQRNWLLHGRNSGANGGAP